MSDQQPGTWEVAAGVYVPPWLEVPETGPEAGRGELLRTLLVEGWEPFAAIPQGDMVMVYVRRRVSS